MPQLPFLDLRDLRARDLRAELTSAIGITVMGVPQGIAYAMIAGLPPAMGLYAAALPAVVGSLLRSSRHVVVGPTNALSLIFASAVAARSADPITSAATLALLVGLLQIGAGLARLGGLVDFISTAVVTGYITGAATLIAVGQLPNVTGTTPTSGDIVTRLLGWVRTLPEASLVGVLLAVGTIGLIVWLRRYLPRGVPTLLALALATASTWALGLEGRGVHVVRDLAPIPLGLPPLTVPDLGDTVALGSVAVAAMVLSLVESTAVARSLAARTGQRLEVSVDFVGLGAANVAAAFTGGYPVSGSLSRSALNVRLGGGRLAGAASGVATMLVLLGLGGVVDHTPIPALAAMILVVAADILDVPTIRNLLRAGPADRWAFVGTVLGAWALPLDQAIYVGVGISIVLFLRRARLLTIRELLVGADGRLHEVDPDGPLGDLRRCRSVRVLHVEGPLFFGAASELESALLDPVEDPEVRVLIVRLKRAQGIDYTAAAVLAHAHEVMRRGGRHLMLVGMREDVMRRLEETGVAAVFESEELYPTQPGWFAAMNQALSRALAIVEEEEHTCADCPLAPYVAAESRVAG